MCRHFIWVLNICCRWVKYDKTDRMQYLSTLISRIKLPLLPATYLLEKVNEFHCYFVQCSWYVRITLDNVDITDCGNHKRIHSLCCSRRGNCTYEQQSSCLDICVNKQNPPRSYSYKYYCWWRELFEKAAVDSLKITKIIKVVNHSEGTGASLPTSTRVVIQRKFSQSQASHSFKGGKKQMSTEYSSEIH